MKKQTFGAMLAALRKEKGMTQLELAEQMGVTDKAVSKWERDLSFPDVTSLPRLAEILEVSVDELMQGKVGKTFLHHRREGGRHRGCGAERSGGGDGRCRGGVVHPKPDRYRSCPGDAGYRSCLSGYIPVIRPERVTGRQPVPG